MIFQKNSCKIVANVVYYTIIKFCHTLRRKTSADSRTRKQKGIPYGKNDLQNKRRLLPRHQH